MVPWISIDKFYSISKITSLDNKNVLTDASRWRRFRVIRVWIREHHCISVHLVRRIRFQTFFISQEIFKKFLCILFGYVVYLESFDEFSNQNWFLTLSTVIWNGFSIFENASEVARKRKSRKCKGGRKTRDTNGMSLSKWKYRTKTKNVKYVKTHNL